jgi:hypothetical protein
MSDSCGIGITGAMSDPCGIGITGAMSDPCGIGITGAMSDPCGIGITGAISDPCGIGITGAILPDFGMTAAPLPWGPEGLNVTGSAAFETARATLRPTIASSIFLIRFKPYDFWAFARAQN